MLIGFPFAFSVRAFPILTDARLEVGEIGMQFLLLLFLPMNYIIEFGFFLIGGLFLPHI